MLKDDIIKVERGNGLPLGATRVGKRQWQFSVAIDRKKEISLLLFRSGESKPAFMQILNKQFMVGGVFSVILTFATDEVMEYLYLAEGKEHLDPYARQIVGNESFGMDENTPKKIRCKMVEDKGCISRPIDIPFHKMILYRLHVRGYTRHSSSKVKAPGTFKGLEEKISYLKQLGINAVMLMPCYEFQECYKENILEQRGGYKPYTKNSSEESTLNYWGYTKHSCYFAPKASYAVNPKRPIEEFKRVIKKLHDNGIAVIMEMYFAYGTNQSLILDCLRHWVHVYGIDGFKINDEIVQKHVVAKDPYLARTKFFATSWNIGDFYEPYDIPDEKQLGEYNDGFMVDARRFLKSDEGQVGAFINRMRKNPLQHGVVNYITNTNGFTLMDMVSYDQKHNEANGENNKDGTEYNYSWNCGWEGPVKKKYVTQLRLRQIKNALVMLFLSQGVPMLLAGDEFGNSQQGNNNAYCQDNEIGWVNWERQVMNQRILSFTKDLIQLRKSHPVFSPEKELRGMDYIACGYPDISFHGTKPWYPDLSNYSRVFGVMFYGKYAPLSMRQSDRTFYVAYNMHWEDHLFELPGLSKGRKWQVFLDTYEVLKNASGEEKADDGILEYMVRPRSIVVFEEVEYKKDTNHKRKAGKS